MEKDWEKKMGAPRVRTLSHTMKENEALRMFRSSCDTRTFFSLPSASFGSGSGSSSSGSGGGGPTAASGSGGSSSSAGDGGGPRKQMQQLPASSMFGAPIDMYKGGVASAVLEMLGAGGGMDATGFELDAGCGDEATPIAPTAPLKPVKPCKMFFFQVVAARPKAFSVKEKADSKTCELDFHDIAISQHGFQSMNQEAKEIMVSVAPTFSSGTELGAPGPAAAAAAAAAAAGGVGGRAGGGNLSISFKNLDIKTK